MDINLNPTTSQVAQTSANAAQPVLSSDFEVFLQMLTAQAEYQDPLEPIDSSEYAAQLAQFSMVEQQVTTNTLMERMLSAMGVGGISNTANWIGKEALVAAPVDFSGAPITISPTTSIADDVALVIRDAQGQEIHRLPLPPGAAPYTWDGRAADGTLVPFGTYSFETEARTNGDVVSTDAAPAYTRITETRIEDGTNVLVLAGGATVAASAVTGLRDPG